MVIYTFDMSSKSYLGSREVPDDYQPLANETKIAPDFTKFGNYVFDGIKWSGTTPDEYAEKFHDTVKASERQIILAQLGYQVANLTLKNQNLKQANQEMGRTVSTLGMQVAQLLAKEQGGN